MSALTIDNRRARHIWLERHLLNTPPQGAQSVSSISEALGFVQLDSIRHVERAHDHILWSRDQKYRPGGLDKALTSRTLFEHFTHDASLIPTRFLPMWKRQFARRAEKIVNAGWWKGMPDANGRAAIKARIAQEGPLCTKDFDSKGPRPKEMWQRPPHKLALDFMWYGGELATSHREKFVKFYDLAERVFPPELWGQELSESAQIDWLCRAALERLGFASAGDIQRFWDAVSAAEVKDWIARNGKELKEVQVQSTDGGFAQMLALSDLMERDVPEPTSSLRILNPFDPAIRDRARALRLFGFDYRNEIFVPAAKRRYGYYVYPILEGARFVGRAELKADRKAGTLSVAHLWPEQGVKWGAGRQRKFDGELKRFARFAGLEASVA